MQTLKIESMLIMQNMELRNKAPFFISDMNKFEQKRTKMIDCKKARCYIEAE